MENKNIVFTHSICVFSSILRPSRIENDVMKYENCNDEYFMMNIQIDRLNAHSLYINKRNKIKLKLMYNIQKNINALYSIRIIPQDNAHEEEILDSISIYSFENEYIVQNESLSNDINIIISDLKKKILKISM